MSLDPVSTIFTGSAATAPSIPLHYKSCTSELPPPIKSCPKYRDTPYCPHSCQMVGWKAQKAIYGERSDPPAHPFRLRSENNLLTNSRTNDPRKMAYLIPWLSSLSKCACYNVLIDTLSSHKLRLQDEISEFAKIGYYREGWRNCLRADFVQFLDRMETMRVLPD